MNEVTTMGDRPNIFEYATKELSQDAMICWFLACLTSKDKFYKAIGVKFIEFILEKESLKADDIVLDNNKPEKQYHEMDVYAVLCVENKAFPIIFEDKTDTYLHSNQMKKYCETVNGLKEEKYLGDIKERNGLEKLEWGKTRYIYFKTGYVPEWQKKDIEEQIKDIKDVDFREIYIDGKDDNKNDIIKFLEELIKKLSEDFQGRKEILIEDYTEYLKGKRTKNEKINNAKWNRILREITGESSHQYSYQGWAVYNILEFENYIEYNLRCDSYKITDGDAICFQQFRDDKKWKRPIKQIEERKENAQRVRNICEEIIPELKSKYNIEFKMENNDSRSGQNTFFRVAISEKNEVDVCAFFKEFIGEFIKEVTADIELSKNLKEVFYECTDIL